MFVPDKKESLCVRYYVGIARWKRSSLLCRFVSYGRKIFVAAAAEIVAASAKVIQQEIDLL